MTPSSEKSKTNKKWTSSEEYRRRWDEIFRPQDPLNESEPQKGKVPNERK